MKLSSVLPGAGISGAAGIFRRALPSLPAFFFLSAACCLLPASCVAADWAMFRGNAGRTGFVPEQAAPPLTRAWEFQAGGGIVSSPAIYDGLVYFGARDGKIYAFNAVSGAPAWQLQTGGRVDSSPAVSGGAVYAVSADGYLYALDRLTGEVLWKALLGAFSISSPLVLDGRVYVGAGAPEKKLKVFETASGNLLAEYPAGQPVDSAPSSDGRRIYFGANDGRLYALAKDSFSLAWSYQAMGGRYGINAVAVSSGIVYAVPGFDENKPLAFNADDGVLLNGLNSPFEAGVLQPDGSLAWTQSGSPVVSTSRLYFSGGSASNTLFAANSVPGSQALAYVWVSSPSLGAVSGAGLLSSPAMANEIIYAGTASGSLVAFTSAAVPVPLTADVSFSSPIYSSPGVSNGMVFVGDSGGKFAAYKAARVSALSSPAPGAVVNGVVALRGCIANPALSGYSLEYSTGGSPEVWHTILASATVHALEDATLAGWDTAALENGNYEVRLRVLEPGQPAYDNTARLALRVNALPAPASGLTAADNPGDTGNRVNLGWTASPAPAITAYRIYRGAGGELARLASVAAGITAYADVSAVTGSTYTYAIRAFDGYAESENSNLASAYSTNDSGDSVPPAAITDLAAEPAPVAGGVLLTWTAPGNDGDLGYASHYLIKYTTVPAYNWGDFDGGGLPVSTRAAEGPAGDNISEEVRGLLGGVTYYFALKAADFIPNLSPLSNIATAYSTPDYTPPLPPAELSAADTPGDAGGRLTLSWTRSPDDSAAGDVYGYKIYRRLQAAPYAEVPYAAVPAGVVSYTDPGATENLRFYYSVAAFDSTNNSALSNEASGVSADNWRFFDAAQGGSVRLLDGARVDIPGGALSQNNSILFNRLDAVTYQPLFRLKTAGPANPTGIVYEVKFSAPATRLLARALVTLPYTDAEVAGMNVENLRIYTLSGGVWAMVNTSSVDASNRRVRAEVSQFSIFRVMEYVPSGALLAEGEVYTYPNPSTGDTLTFKFRPSYKAHVSIEIYNVAGEKVAVLEKANCPGGAVSEIAWGIRNIASGVYIYSLKAESAAGSKRVTKKLAIVH